MDNKNKIAISIQNENSTNLLRNSTNNLFKSYKTLFYGFHYNFQSFTNSNLFPIKFASSINSYFGNRTADATKTKQTKLEFTGYYNWQLHYKNYIYTKFNSGYLISDNYLESELFKIGGYNTIRGFNDASVFASLYNIANIEYRYLIKNDAYLYSITDFGYIKKDKSENKLYSFGLGYAFETKIGLLNLNYSIGKSNNENFDFRKGVVGLRYVTRF